MLAPRGSADHQEIFDALADPTRRAIVERLSVTSSSTISELSAGFSMTRQAVTKHLAQLERAGLVTIETRGRERHVSLRPQTLEAATDWLEEVGRRWDDRLAALQKHLSESP